MEFLRRAAQRRTDGRDGGTEWDCHLARVERALNAELRIVNSESPLEKATSTTKNLQTHQLCLFYYFTLLIAD